VKVAVICVGPLNKLPPLSVGPERALLITVAQVAVRVMVTEPVNPAEFIHDPLAVVLLVKVIVYWNQAEQGPFG
jgi:hypothetical protein